MPIWRNNTPTTNRAGQEDVRNRLHWAVRKSLAAAFWAHALGLTQLLGLVPLWNRVSLVPAIQTSMLLTIGFYSFVAKSAGWSMLVDALYVYVSPVVLLGRVSWAMMKSVGRALKEASPQLEDLFGPSQTRPHTEERTDVQEKAESEPAATGVLELIGKPFMHFPACWCVLVGVSPQKWLLALSLIPLLTITVRTTALLHSALNSSSTLLAAISDKFKQAIEKISTDITSGSPNSKQFKDALTNFKVYSALLRYLGSTESARKVTRKFSLGVAVPTYIYTSVLCGFIYFDIARLSNLKWPLGEALTDALYMPIAFTDLPHSYPIRLLAGVQVALFVLIGYEAIFRSVNEKMQRLSTAAQGLSLMLEAERIKKAVSRYDAADPTNNREAQAPLGSHAATDDTRDPKGASLYE